MTQKNRLSDSLKRSARRTTTDDESPASSDDARFEAADRAMAGGGYGRAAQAPTDEGRRSKNANVDFSPSSWTASNADRALLRKIRGELSLTAADDVNNSEVIRAALRCYGAADDDTRLKYHRQTLKELGFVGGRKT